jgi:hypothetical protein
MSRKFNYKVDVYFRCRGSTRLYMLLGCLKEVAIKLGAKNPYPTYLGAGVFQVAWSKGGLAEIQDTREGVARLWTTKVDKAKYGVIRSVFREYWEENYDVVNQAKSRATRRLTNMEDLLARRL